MPTFKLDHVRATLLPIKIIRDKKVGGGEGKDPIDVSEVEMALDLGGDGDIDKSLARALEVLLPGVGMQIKAIGTADTPAGFDHTPRGKLPDLSVTLFSKKDGVRPIVPPIACTVKSKAKIRVSEKGNAILELRRVTGSTEYETVPKLFRFIRGDVFVSVDPVQIEMDEIVEATGKAAKKKQKDAFAEDGES